MNPRLTVLKTVLWSLVGAFIVLTVVRFAYGLGATTELSDVTPWGFWIAFDVLAGVALTAGGFVIAAVVLIFGRKEYLPFVRPAILTALLGYIADAIGTTYDLGLPWNFWHPLIHHQYHSVLFLIAMCVIFYLSVLFLLMTPTVLEHPRFQTPRFQRIHKLLKRIMVPILIVGVVLSILHQSSLGSLFLIAPYRVHALWYSPNIWLLFLVSAVALGLMMVILESFISGWIFKHKPNMKPVSGLARAASWVLLVYVVLRIGDLATRGLAGSLLDGSWQSNLLIFELALSAVVPALLLMLKPVRTSAAGVATCAGMTIAGMILYRFDVCLVAFLRPETMPYFPSWMEVAISLGIVAIVALLYLFIVERFRVLPEDHVPSQPVSRLAGIDFSPSSVRGFLPIAFAVPRRYSLAVITAAAATAALLPAATFSTGQLPETPVQPPRTMSATLQMKVSGQGHEITLTEPGVVPRAKQKAIQVMAVDGNRDGRLVLFPHDEHVKRHGDQSSCVICHHQNMPFDSNTSCAECHLDMYLTTDIFDHASHVTVLDGNDGCARCHEEPSVTKSRQSALGCGECHEALIARDSFIQPAENNPPGFAPGYMTAMHELCIACHEKELEKSPSRYSPRLAECATCHRDIDGDALQQMQPYVLKRAEKP